MTPGSKSLLQVGDRIKFNGLRGQDSDNLPADDPALTILLVVNVSISGNVSFQITTPNGSDASSPDNFSIHATPYTLVEKLLEDNVWELLEPEGDDTA